MYLDEKLIAVNSGCRTTDKWYRSRGIFVLKEHRNYNISKMLFSAIDDNAINEGCNMVWSIPRKTALPAYLSAGYRRVSDYFNEGMEFGPNCYVSKVL